jgi:glycosyltransferase involved in cell wall biosynthesis
MKVTVVIPAFNEERYIGACLACLEAQTLSRDQFEVIVVDNGSTDNTLSIVGSFKGSLPLRSISMPKISVSAVRNLGASLATGEILAFLDADCMTSRDWLSNAIELEQSRGVWGAHYLVPADANWISKIWFTYQAKEYEGPVSFIPSSNMFIRRADFNALKGFDESVQTSEDVEFCARAHEAGMEIIAFRSLAVVHEGIPRNLLQFYRQNRWHGEQLLRLFIQNLPSTRNFPLIAISFYTLFMFWVTVVTLIAACVLRYWIIPIYAAVLLVLPPLLLAFRKAGKSRSAIGPLAILYAVYLLARAAALTHVAPVKSWKQ